VDARYEKVKFKAKMLETEARKKEELNAVGNFNV